MWRRIAQLAGALVLVVVGASIIFLAAMRSKHPPTLAAIRRLNRAVTNPREMKTAGQPGANASVIRHVGRTSGKSYETPIGPFPTDDGFVIPLPYGTTPDWLKNVQRSGTATIITEGETWNVNQPEIIGSAEAMPDIPPKYQRSLRWFNVTDFLQVRQVDAPKLD